jgi:drug/metabolite transporter (DMT)-like permease
VRLSAGTLFSLASGAAFGSMAIFGKLSYEEGVSVGTLLAVRFSIGAVLFWGLLAAGGGLTEARGVSRRDIGIGLLLGGVGYAAQAGLYFVALERIDASILALLLYTFPAMVAVAAVVLGREHFNSRKVVALGFTSVGLVFVLAGAASGSFNALGAVFALGAAVVYTTYILSSQGIAARTSPYVLSALVCTGGAISLTIGTSIAGQLHPEDVTAKGWLWLFCIGVVATVVAIGFFFAGLRRVGPTSASILATVEPVVTVFLAFIVFGETFAALQILGAALVLTSVFVLQARSREPAPAVPV